VTETPSSPQPQGLQPGPQAAPPPVHAGWAVAALLFFWPLSFSAFTHAFNVYPLWARGDVAGAQAASDRVRRLGQLSLWLAGGLFLLFLIVYALFIMAWIAYGGDGPHHFHHQYND
jgi:Interferon-induced transmembrane protein